MNKYNPLGFKIGELSKLIKETIEKNKLLSVLNSSFKSVLADYNSSKNLSDVTEMKSLLDNYRLLIEQISSNDEKIKEDYQIRVKGKKIANGNDSNIKGTRSDFRY